MSQSEQEPTLGTIATHAFTDRERLLFLRSIIDTQLQLNTQEVAQLSVNAVGNIASYEAISDLVTVLMDPTSNLEDYLGTHPIMAECSITALAPGYTGPLTDLQPLQPNETVNVQELFHQYSLTNGRALPPQEAISVAQEEHTPPLGDVRMDSLIQRNPALEILTQEDQWVNTEGIHCIRFATLRGLIERKDGRTDELSITQFFNQQKTKWEASLDVVSYVDPHHGNARMYSIKDSYAFIQYLDQYFQHSERTNFQFRTQPISTEPVKKN